MESYITATIRSGEERLYEALGEVRIQPTRLERTAGASSAGRLWIVETARPIRAIMTFANRCSVDPMELFCSHCNMSVNIIEKSRGFTHLLMGAVVIGMPEKNLATGEGVGHGNSRWRIHRPRITGDEPDLPSPRFWTAAAVKPNTERGVFT